MVDAFTPLLAHAPKAGVEVVRDLSYGDDERQQLDVYTPGRAGSRPVVLFVHGGAFTGGERNRSPELHANVLYYVAFGRASVRERVWQNVVITVAAVTLKTKK